MGDDIFLRIFFLIRDLIFFLIFFLRVCGIFFGCFCIGFIVGLSLMWYLFLNLLSFLNIFLNLLRICFLDIGLNCDDVVVSLWIILIVSNLSFL